MLKEVDMMTALEVTLQGGTAVRVMEVQDVAGMTVYELMHSGENEYRYLVDEPDDKPVIPDTVKADEPKAETEAAPEAEPAPESSGSVLENFHAVSVKKERGKPGPKTKPVDVGKINALADAGWSQGAIASEMHLSVSTVRKYLTGIELEEAE